jgi:hypothetical protein
MTAFSRLDPMTRAALILRTAFRQARFVAKEIPTKGSVLLVGDRPAPDAPDDMTFHYTPFGVLKHSSLWLNLQLHDHGIPEERLYWVNAYNHLGHPTDHKILDTDAQVIALGGNANAWVKKHQEHGHWTVQHPQAWKRFRAKEPYPLMECLAFLR